MRNTSILSTSVSLESSLCQAFAWQIALVLIAKVMATSIYLAREISIVDIQIIYDEATKLYQLKETAWITEQLEK